METPRYSEFISDSLLQYLLRQTQPVPGAEGLRSVFEGDTPPETIDALRFIRDLYQSVKTPLNAVLRQRAIDRQFIDQRTAACAQLNRTLKIDFLDPNYHTVIGHEDAKGRIVVGPLHDRYHSDNGGKKIASIPESLKGNHVTLFGPPDDAKLSINAMNSYHRKIQDEPPIVAELLKSSSDLPKWGADDEDSKTPLHSDLISAAQNLSKCFDGSLEYTDPQTRKKYSILPEKRTLPIKRFPGLALPCTFLFYDGLPIPLHLYDFALHLFQNWRHSHALAFYVPKLENEEEARYIKLMVHSAETLLHKRHPEYVIGSIRLFIVLENPRAVFRVHEIMDALHPYFSGASLGWHDFLASTARLMKNDSNYRIPVKADPNIVIQYIKASHDLLEKVVGSRGGIKIGGMYGVLPIGTELMSPSFQVTMRGFIRDVVTQLKRGLNGFWVAHPDFVRIGMALVEAWKQDRSGSRMEQLATSLLDPSHHEEILSFIRAPDIQGLDPKDPLYPRSLLVADIRHSQVIANNDPEEIRYNVFQSLQYIADWLCGNGCVALPAEISGVAVRVMDDLATAERSRWEVWHEIHHGRFKVSDLIRIAHEEMRFIRKDFSNSKKIVQVKWDARTEKWYPVAFKIMLQLMTGKSPPEFASELLLPFTIPSIRSASDPWKAIQEIETEKYALDPLISRIETYFSFCGSMHFALPMAQSSFNDFALGEKLILGFSMEQIIEAASFHGDIGESKKTLDETASREQSGVLNGEAGVQTELKNQGQRYKEKFGFKYLVSAQGKSGAELLINLKGRLQNTVDAELDNARSALWEITKKRLDSSELNSLQKQIKTAFKKHSISGAQIHLTTSMDSGGILCLGDRVPQRDPVTPESYFQIASLSKTLGSCLSLEVLSKHKIPLDASVNSLLKQTSSTFQIPGPMGNSVTVAHLMNHSALNMHYVNGFPVSGKIPALRELLDGNDEFQYAAIQVAHPPGTQFQYSGGGFLVLEHLIESLEGKNIHEVAKPFFEKLGIQDLSFQYKIQPGDEFEKVRLAFPAFAAGAMGTATAVSSFLRQLTHAFHSLEGSGPISHDTAVNMLRCTDRSSQSFMGVNIGLGVFTAEAGPNRLAIHQGANDGFRCLFVHCYQGPDSGKGFVILCNGDSEAIPFIAETAQAILKDLKMEGIDLDCFKNQFDPSKMKAAEIVNLGYKELIFGAFSPDLPEKISNPGPLDPLADFNAAVGAEIMEVTNQGFARAENLFSPYQPIFDPELYGRQGKVMDSWESVRHNPRPCDQITFKIKKASKISTVAFSTQFHLGNQAPIVMLEGQDPASGQWTTIIEKTALEGHSLKFLDAPPSQVLFQVLRVSIFPDGGLTRIGLFDDRLPGKPVSGGCTDPIPAAMKPLTPRYSAGFLSHASQSEIANAAAGGKIISSSNEHYGPAVQIISPFPPLNMFDGFESARSRKPNHQEEVVIGFLKKSPIHRIEIDFTYFRNNNPRELALYGLCDQQWVLLVPKTPVKAYAGNQIAFKIERTELFEQLKICVFPDGGLNRVRVFSGPSKQK